MIVRILGIDPSLAQTGLGIIEVNTETKAKSLIAVGCIGQDKKIEIENIIRVKPIIDKIQEQLDAYILDFIAMESMNVYIGKKTIGILLKLAGIIEYAVCCYGQLLSYVTKSQEKSVLGVYVKHPKPITKKDKKLMSKEELKIAIKKYKEEKAIAKEQEKQFVKDKIMEIYKPARDINFDESDALAVANVVADEILERGIEED